MKILLSIIFLVIGISTLIYTSINNIKLLKDFKEMESDLGISY